jgi:hypothetical protein
MEFQQAWEAVAQGGRMLGSGPAAAAWLITGVKPVDYLVTHNVERERAATINLGIAVGLVMAEESMALSILAEIESEWKGGN